MCLLLGGGAAAQQYDQVAERQLVQLLNQERARQGLSSLKVDDRLTQAARAHSPLMAQAKQLSHQMPGEPGLSKRLAATKLRSNDDAENVAYDYSVPAVHDGWLHSPGHRENMLSPKYNVVGIGVVKSGDVYWVTADFAHRPEEYSVNDAENAIIAGWERERRRVRGAPAQVLRLPELRSLACNMAKRGSLDTRAALKLPGVESAVTYTQPDPQTLAPNAIKMAHDPGVKRFGVGACFGDGDKYPSGTWWVAMVFY